jgi:hypothetical protein
MMKLDLKTIGKVVEPVLEIAACSFLVWASYKYVGDTTAIDNDLSAGYDDAVKAIMDSDMYSHDKQSAVSALKLHGTAEFYKAIVYITNSGMYSHEKVESIKRLCEK